MQEIGIYEAKTNFGQLVSRVEAGEQIAITRRGKTVAQLVPFNSVVFNRQAALDAAARITERSEGMSLGGLKIKDVISEGRK